MLESDGAFMFGDFEIHQKAWLNISRASMLERLM